MALPPKTVNRRGFQGQRWVIPLIDDDNRDNPPIFVEIQATPNGIEIFAKDYGLQTMATDEGSVVFIEHYAGSLRMTAWGDINFEEPTFSMNFDDAREVLRDDAHEEEP